MNRSKKLVALRLAQDCRCILCWARLPIVGSRGPNSPQRPTLDHVWPRTPPMLRSSHRAKAVRRGNVRNLLAAHKLCNERRGNRWPTGCELIWLEVVNVKLPGLLAQSARKLARIEVEQVRDGAHRPARPVEPAAVAEHALRDRA